MKHLRRINRGMAVCLAALLLLCASVFPSAAEEGTRSYSALKNPSGPFIAVSKYGNTRAYPEQSAEAVLSAAEQGADMIYVRVRKTSDNYLVLMADENLSRMCVDSVGNPVHKNISEVGYHELSTYHLRKSTGSLHEPITACVIPTLQEVLTQLNGKAMLLIDGAWAFRDEVYNLLTEQNALNAAVLLSDGDKKETASWLSSKATMPLVISSYSGNIVFQAQSMVSKTLSAGAVGTLLATGNAYGMNFKNSVMHKFRENGRAVIDMTDPALCGKREDNFEGWEDVTARGYSVIITNNIPELLEYFSAVYKQKERLSASIEDAQAVDVTLCSTASSKALKDEITKAKAALDEPLSVRTLMEANYSLQMSVNGLTNRTDEPDGKTVTTGRVVAVVLVVAALILLEVILETVRRNKFKKRKKALREQRIREEHAQKHE